MDASTTFENSIKTPKNGNSYIRIYFKYLSQPSSIFYLQNLKIVALLDLANEGNILVFFGIACSVEVCRKLFGNIGALALLWYILWMVVVTNSPNQDSKITESELNYIESSLEQIPKDEADKIPIPWKSMARNKAVWAICVSNFAENWGFYTFLTQLPKYLKDIYNFNLGTSGFLSGLPYLAMGIMLPLSGQLADFLISKGYLTVTQTRRSASFLGFVAQFCFLMTVAYVSSEVVTVLCLTCAIGIGAVAFGAYCVNPLDIAPEYASIILGVSNTFGTIPGIASPILSGYIVSDNPTTYEWRIVFFVAASIYLFGAFFYVICGSGEVQEWAQSIKKEEDCDKS